MNEATQITMPYTIAVYMVRDYLGPDASQAQISRLTGILVRLLAFTMSWLAKSTPQHMSLFCIGSVLLCSSIHILHSTGIPE